MKEIINGHEVDFISGTIKGKNILRWIFTGKNGERWGGWGYGATKQQLIEQFRETVKENNL